MSLASAGSESRKASAWYCFAAQGAYACTELVEVTKARILGSHVKALTRWFGCSGGVGNRTVLHS
ncbi:MAG: hypothetical protein SXV54_15030 [Chloroflexota bacterium]|nr:hypothetical protein [Chloroflexota bacterium]